MLAVILKILCVLGILLLILLGVVLACILLVLFFPVTYRIKGSKNASQITVNCRANWLFGLLRVRYVYPKPGRVLIKVLWFTVFDSLEPDDDTVSAAKDSAEEDKERKPQPAKKAEKSPDRQKALQDQKSAKNQENLTGAEEEEQVPKEETAAPKSLKERIFAKYEKIKYTIRKICDKIKEILENISFYKELLEEENTRELFRHACRRVGKILKSIRPRKLKADILFGAASPDTTGYLYGVYSMISPRLGKNIFVTPDFTQAVLEGEMDAAGHITVFRILWNGILLLLDKRLRILIRKVKHHTPPKKEETSK